MKNRTALGWLFVVLHLWAWSSARAEDKPAEIDKGTDPTKVSRVFQITYEHMGMKDGLASDTFKFNYSVPFGERNDYSARLRVPVMRITGIGSDETYGLGDASVQVGHVFGLTREGGYVAQAEIVADTAARPELGAGKFVVKGTFIAARFLQGGDIFAPSVVHSTSIAGRSDRINVSATTFDFYYVPRLADPRNLLTFDPSLNFDWDSGKRFLGLAITYGRVLGRQFGANAIFTIKPSFITGGERIFAGERTGTWGIEIGYKLIGF